MTREQAISAFAELIARYGLQWGKTVPAKAYAEMAEISGVLSIDDKLAILRRR